MRDAKLVGVDEALRQPVRMHDACEHECPAIIHRPVKKGLTKAGPHRLVGIPGYESDSCNAPLPIPEPLRDPRGAKPGGVRLP
jgi:hypothetical protein